MVCMGMFLLLLFGTLLASADNIDRKHAKCLVCHRVVEELFKEIGDASPFIKQETGRGGKLMNHKKTMKPVEIGKLEMYFDDLMDRLCKKMGEYVRVFNKSSGQLEVIPLLINGKMNFNMSSYDIIKDGDIESLEFYCESIISEYGEEMLQLFKEGVSSEIYTQDLCLNPEICKSPGSVPLPKVEF